MPRGSEYANAPIQSDNPIEAGETKAHGTSGNTDLNRVNKVAEFPEGAEGTGTAANPHSGQGSAGHQDGKGGHDPRSIGQKKGLSAQ